MANKPLLTETEPNSLAPADRSQPFLHRWNDLVSVTNWEKGRIICEWRDALEADAAAVSDYSDEAWAQRVGHVTGQHVGRLRRVWERFGGVQADYPGLYWSHFQVALDWDDAEMWLEGAVQSGWSVSQMRAQRWETLGVPEALRPRDEEIVTADWDEDAPAPADNGDRLTPERAEVRDVRDEDEPFEAAEGGSNSPAGRNTAEPHLADDDPAPRPAAAARARPFENLPPLPEDVSEAFEQMKLAILTHKLADWSEISRDDLLVCLDALRELALQPSGD